MVGERYHLVTYPAEFEYRMESRQEFARLAPATVPWNLILH